jgi:DNA (cytosine-5)-methyltransferase 1
MTHLDLFSGCGGFAKGIQEAGHKITKHYFSEVDKHAIANYKYNFKEAEYVGAVQDVRRIEADIITFGSPCQDFSLAGKRKGMDGSRSSLILEAIRIIGESRPSVFIWENVKGTFSSNNGADFWAILAAFANIGGYRLEWQLLNTSWFLPQNRERIYLVGHLDGRSKPGVFPFRETDTRSFERSINATIVKIINSGGSLSGYCSSMTLVNQINPSKESGGKQPYQQNRVYDSNGIMTSLTSLEKNNIQIKSNTSKGYDIATEQDSINLSVPTSKTRRGRVGKGKAQTIDTQANQGVLNGSQIRRLTEIECERLQGFPDGWTKYGVFDGETKEISRTQRYKLLGNAVTVDVVKAVAQRIKL